MAAATRTNKQKTAKKDVILTEGWKPMKGFGRYAFYKDGTVVNIATGTKLEKSAKNGTAFQLTADNGGRQAVTVDAVKTLFEASKEAPAKAPIKVAPAKKVKMQNGEEVQAARVGAKLDYDTAMDIRRRVAAGEKRGAIAKEFSVDGWTIQAIVIGFTYRLREGDANPIPTEMMEAFLQKNLPKVWQGKTMEELKALAKA